MSAPTTAGPEIRLDESPLSPDNPVPQPSPAADGVWFAVLLLVASTLALMLAIGEFFPDALVVVSILTVLAVTAARTDARWLRWVLGVLSVVFVGVNLPYMISDLQHPESATSFIPSLAIGAFGICAAALSFAAARRRQMPARTILMAAAGVVLAGAVVSVIATAGVEDAVAQIDDTIIVAEDIAYPDQVQLTGAAVVVRNADRYRHSFVIDGLVDTVEVPASSDVRIPLDLAAGTYRYYCDLPGHDGMEGSLLVP